MSFGNINFNRPLNEQHPLVKGMYAFWMPFNKNGMGGSTLFDLTNSFTNNHIPIGRISSSPSIVTSKDKTSLLFSGSKFAIANRVFNHPRATIWAVVTIHALPAGLARIAGCTQGNGGQNADKLLAVTSGGLFHAMGYDGGVKSVNGGNVVLGKRTLLHMTADGTNVRLYQDGVLVGSVACGNTFVSYGGNNLLLGGVVQSTYITYLNFTCEAWGIYTKALTSTEVALFAQEWKNDFPNLLNRSSLNIPRRPFVHNSYDETKLLCGPPIFTGPSLAKTNTLSNVNLQNPINYKNPINNGLVGFWMGLPKSGHFGGNTFRSLVNGTPDGIVFGSRGTDATGSIILPRVQSRVEIQSIPKLQPTVKLTTISYFKLSSLPVSYSTVISKPLNGPTWNPPYLTWMIRIHSSGNIEYAVGTGVYSNNQIASSWRFNTWYQLAMTYDGAILRLYKDGVQIATSTTRTGNLSWSSNPWLLAAGYGNTTDYEGINGIIGPTAIYSRTLSAYEINKHNLEFKTNFPTILNRVKSTPTIFNIYDDTKPVTGGTPRGIIPGAKYSATLSNIDMRNPISNNSLGKGLVALYVPLNKNGLTGVNILYDLAGKNHAFSRRILTTPFGRVTTSFNRICVRYPNFNNVTTANTGAYHEALRTTSNSITGPITLFVLFTAGTFEISSKTNNSGLIGRYTFQTDNLVTSNNRSYGLNLTSSSGRKIQGVISSNGTTGESITGTTSLQPNIMYSACFVFTPGVSLKLYLNGILDNSIATSTTSLFNSTSVVRIGSQGTSASWYALDGNIFNSGIYNRALTDGEIHKLHDEMTLNFPTIINRLSTHAYTVTRSDTTPPELPSKPVFQSLLAFWIGGARLPLFSTLSVRMNTQFIWNTFAVTNNSVGLLWNTLSVIGISKQFLYNIRSLVFKEEQFIWNILQTAGVNVQLLYNVLQKTQKSSEFIWNVAQLTNKELQLIWDTNAITTANQSVNLLWNVRAAVNKDSQFVWNTRELVEKDNQFIWNVRTSAGKDVEFDWDIYSLASKSVQALWNTRQNVNKEVELNWNIYANVNKNIDVLWNTYQKAGNSVEFQYNVRQIVFKSLEAVWDVRQLSSAQIELLWDVIVDVAITTVIEMMFQIKHGMDIDINILATKLLEARINGSKNMDLGVSNSRVLDVQVQKIKTIPLDKNGA